MADLVTQVGTLSLATPVIAASGTYGYGTEFDGLVDWPGVGGVSVKGISVQPCDGLPATRMVETPAGMLNAIGLQNVGVEAFLNDKLPELAKLGPRIIVNCWGNTPEEFSEVVERLDPAGDLIDAIELNLACPNKKEWGRIFACDPAAVKAIVGPARARTKLPLWVKLSPSVTDITEPATVAAGEGADALCVINTVRGMAIDVERRRPVLSNITGGLSGPAIKPIGLLMVYEASRAVDIPVVGGGGIVSGSDAVEYLMAGACAVQVGTANLYDPAAPARISREIASVLDRLGEARVSGVVGALETSS